MTTKQNVAHFIEGASMVVLGEEPIQNSTVHKMFSQLMQRRLPTSAATARKTVNKPLKTTA